MSLGHFILRRQIRNSGVLSAVDAGLGGSLPAILARQRVAVSWIRVIRPLIAALLMVGLGLLVGYAGALRASTPWVVVGAVISGAGYVIEIVLLVLGNRVATPATTVIDTKDLVLFLERHEADWGDLGTQRTILLRLESLARKYERLPLMLATGSRQERQELRRRGAQMAGDLRSLKRRVHTPSTFPVEHLLVHLRRHLSLQVCNRWDRLPLGVTPEDFDGSSRSARILTYALGGVLLVIAVALPIVGSVWGFPGTAGGLVVSVIAVTVLTRAGLSPRVAQQLRDALLQPAA
ncbi:hypothetical protein [Geodermatophilus dictyosporus]|uniref:hypothetical protein n=1 Tax=Geodermatophilus dictyosporus TaxID=1523247 RepID=UPI000B81DD16|nr:hypothetical protein [Geodermatophilus dictyosporus]